MRLGYVLCRVGPGVGARDRWVDVAFEEVVVDANDLSDPQVTGMIERMGTWATTRLVDHRGEMEIFEVTVSMLNANGEPEYSLAEEYRLVSMGQAVHTGVLTDTRERVEAALAWRAERGLG